MRSASPRETAGEDRAETETVDAETGHQTLIQIGTFDESQPYANR